MRTILCVVLTALVTGITAGAQGISTTPGAPIAVGDRVRITLYGRTSPDESLVEAIEGERIVVRGTDRIRRPILLGEIRVLEISAGRRPFGERVLRGTGTGELVGAGLGAGIGAMSGGGCDDTNRWSAREAAAVGAYIFGGA
jgi:hypothetical protein